MRIILLFALGLLIISGCLQSVGGDTYTTDYASDMARVAITDPDQIAQCEFGKCWCMVCENGTNIFGSSITSLIGGYCYVEEDCNETVSHSLYSTNQTPSLSIRSFMIGQGPTIADFADATPYCSYRLNMAVQFLTATNESPYLLPDAARSMCLLSKDVMPVYVLYSAGENINNTQARMVGEVLGTEGDDLFLGRLSDGPVGPVVVVTEIDFNRSDVSQIADQVRAINDGCRNVRTGDDARVNCWVAVAPKFNDFDTLDAVMAQVGDEVDLVAYGVNGKYVDACTNNRINTGKMMNQIRNYTTYSLYNLSKPTIIPYVLFDPGTSDAGGCNWTEADVVSAYAAFWPNGIQSLQQKGLIGIAPYSFNSSDYGYIANPLGCNDCSVGANDARMRAWYGWCQSYTNVSGRNSPHPGGGTPIIFPNASGGYCDFNAQADYLLREVSFMDSGSNRDIMNPQTPEVRPAGDPLFRCSACVNYNLSLDALSHFSFTPNEGAPPERYCEDYPQIEHWADARNLDPMFVRAIILTESGFDPCAAARVCREGYNDPLCFQQGLSVDECYNKPAYDEAWDPDITCNVNLTPASNSNSATPDWRWCAFGLMQVIKPPYTYWPASDHPDGVDGPYFDIYNRTGFYPQELDSLKACAAPDGEYNPFNPSHSICAGTLGISSMLRNARGAVDDAHTAGLLNWGSDEAEKNELFSYYIVGHMYTGFWGASNRKYVGSIPPPCGSGTIGNGQCLLQEFHKAWTVDDEYCESEDGQDDTIACDGDHPRVDPPEACYGYTDILLFYEHCFQPFLQREADPGREKMEAYLWLRNCPNNMCPDGQALINAICEPDETGAVDPSLCLGPNQPLVTGNPYMIEEEAEEETEGE